MLIHTLLATLLFPATPQEPAEKVTPGEAAATSILDVQLNTFTESSQDNVSLGQAPDGTFVTVWHSRRQEGGTYGIRARLISPDGETLTGEVAVNETVEGMQVEPSLSVGPSGAAWFAWVSRGQDGDGDGVYARRFSNTLEGATAEVRVNESVEGDQSEPSIVALDDGRAICVWSGPAPAAADERQGHERAIFARVLGADGVPTTPSITLGGDSAFSYRTPAAVGYGDGAMVAVSSHDDAGVPTGIFAVAIDGSGKASEAVRIDGGLAGVLPVEPSLSAADGRVAFAWLEAQKGDSSGEYAIRWRNLVAEESSTLGSLTEIQSVDAPEAGYTSGLAVAAQGSKTALLWSRYLAAENGTPRLYCTVFDEAGEGTGEELSQTTLLATSRATKVEAGKQAMSVGGAGQRALFTEDGRIAGVWHGDAELGDKSGAHVSLITFEEDGERPRICLLYTSPSPRD